MPPPLPDDDDQYASSEDSDFAPEKAQGPGSDLSDSDDAEPSEPKRSAKRAEEAEDAGYDNSGDEAIIKKDAKRRRRAKEKGAPDEDLGGDGGLVKTRAQRAAEKEERRYATNHGPVTVDVDALWTEMLAGKPAPPPDNQYDEDAQGVDAETDAQPVQNEDDATGTIRIKRTYNFAGRVHTEEKVVPRDSAEAKLYLATQGEGGIPSDGLPTKRITKKAFRSAFEPVGEFLPQRADLNLGVAAMAQAGQEARKLNTIEKSRMDWAGYVDKEGIKDDLQAAGRSKNSYNAREDFLARSEARRENDARQARIAGRA